jgi:hypothetical protein
MRKREESTLERATGRYGQGDVVQTPDQVSRRRALKLGLLGAASLVAARRSSLANGPQSAEQGLHTVPGIDLQYYLIPYDENGAERSWYGQLVSRNVRQRLISDPITDVFICSHGWRGDIRDAISQYNGWIGAMASCGEDVKSMRELRRDFAPLIIGLHWPSLPFGDEELRASYAAGFGGDTVRATDARAELFAKRIADTRRARDALAIILGAAGANDQPRLPQPVVKAFKTLQLEAGLRSGGAAGAPGNDCEAFDPQALYAGIQSDRSFAEQGQLVGGADDLNPILQMLGYLSFWQMKNRARLFGESGAHQLLHSLQRDVPPPRNVRFHLMGHSFGCIVVSACVAGPVGQFSAIPVNSLSLVQGALSHWSYCSNVDAAITPNAASHGGTPGYFRRIVDRRLVNGPIVTTQSTFDSAVGKLYPKAAWLAAQLAYAANEYPKYGAVGAFGLQGPGCGAINRELLDAIAP